MKINDIRVARAPAGSPGAGLPMKWMLAAFCLILPAAQASAASVVKSYAYYTIDAPTLDELDKQLESRGPRVESSGRKHPGATRMRFTTRTTYSQDGGRCRVAAAHTVLKVEIILPRWRPRHKPETDMRIIWDTLASDITRHEGLHVDIAKNYAAKLEQSIRTLGSAATCAGMAAAVKKATARILEEHDRAQLQFDRVENINFEDRFQRLLDYRLQQMKDRQSREPGGPRPHR
jgi:predicted secreted Zn-dependent protease